MEPYGQAAGLADSLDELASLRRVEGTRWVVDQHPRGTEVVQMMGPVEQDFRLPAEARAVHEPDRQLLAGLADRLRGFPEVREVVQRIVDPEDVDPALGRARDEAADEIARERTGADEQTAAERHPERSGTAGLDGADALPGAFHSARDGRVEATAARDLEVRESGAVENLGELENARGLHSLGERLLREKPDAGVDESRHVTRGRCSGPRACRP